MGGRTRLQLEIEMENNRKWNQNREYEEKRGRKQKLEEAVRGGMGVRPDRATHANWLSHASC